MQKIKKIDRKKKQAVFFSIKNLLHSFCANLYYVKMNWHNFVNIGKRKKNIVNMNSTGPMLHTPFAIRAPHTGVQSQDQRKSCQREKSQAHLIGSYVSPNVQCMKWLKWGIIFKYRYARYMPPKAVSWYCSYHLKNIWKFRVDFPICLVSVAMSNQRDIQHLIVVRSMKTVSPNLQ